MAWENRGSTQEYYYQSRRINGHVRKIYIGSGVGAQKAYVMDQQRQAQRAQEHVFWKKIEALNTQTETLRDTTRTLIKAHLLTHGFHQHKRGDWRKRHTHITQEGDHMTITALAVQENLSIDTLTSLVHSAMTGDETTLPAIRSLLDQAPAIWRETFNISQRVEQAWIQTIAGHDLMTREALIRQVAALRVTLEVESYSPLECLIIETICTTWLAYKQAELSAAERLRSGLALSGQQENHLTACLKRYLSAIRELARIRQLLAPRSTTVLNIAQQQQVNLN